MPLPVWLSNIIIFAEFYFQSYFFKAIKFACCNMSFYFICLYLSIVSSFWSKFSSYQTLNKMGEVVEDLNYDFNYNMFLTKTMLTLLTSLSGKLKEIPRCILCRTKHDNTRSNNSRYFHVFSKILKCIWLWIFLLDRTRAVRWMRKLTTCNRSIEEMKLRNDFMYYLVLNVQNGELRPPFTDNPPPGALPAIAHLLVS